MISAIKISPHISIQSELKPFAGKEKDILQKIKKKKTKFFLSTLAGFLTLIPIGWYISLNRRYYGYNRRSSLLDRGLNEDSMQLMRKLVPYFYLFVFLLISGYFIHYYYKLINPIIKDLRKGMKEILYYDPEKYQTPFFAEYYIITPILKKTRVRIDKELYNAIQPGSTAAISYSIHSHFIFSIEIGEKEIFFNETNESVDV